MSTILSFVFECPRNLEDHTVSRLPVWTCPNEKMNAMFKFLENWYQGPGDPFNYQEEHAAFVLTVSRSGSFVTAHFFDIEEQNYKMAVFQRIG